MAQIVVVFTTIVGINNLVIYGFNGAGIPILLTTLVLTTIFLEIRYSLLVLFIGLISMTIIGYLFIEKILILDIALYEISTFPISWFTASATLLFLGLLIIVSIGTIQKKMMGSNIELIKHREHLEEIIENRTAQLQEQNFELDLRSREIEEANRLKSEFLSNMSHELRTPLNSVITLSNVLSRQAKDKLNDEENSYLEIIERNGKKLLELINEILDLSKIESGKAEIITDDINVGQLIGIIKDSLKPLAVEKGIVLNLKLPKKLPMVVTDESRLHQVFTNVISNAVKFTEKGLVDIIVKNDTKNVYVDIKDTGIGISEESLPHIFDEFRQVDGTTARQFEGTGLGLAIAYKTINLLGGTIRVKSKLGKGSTFSITIPIKWKKNK